MIDYLILCRSLTHAQRSASVLERSGISARVMRCPKEISSEGCSHCVRIGYRTFAKALGILLQSGLEPKHVFERDGSGGFQEVELP